MGAGAGRGRAFLMEKQERGQLSWPKRLSVGSGGHRKALANRKQGGLRVGGLLDNTLDKGGGAEGPVTASIHKDPMAMFPSWAKTQEEPVGIAACKWGTSDNKHGVLPRETGLVGAWKQQ